MNSFQRTDKEQEQHEALFAARLTAACTSRCSTPDSDSECSITDDDADAIGLYAFINATPSVISGGRHGEAPQRTEEGPEGWPARRLDCVHLQQPRCRCGQDVVILPCGHEFCVLCCLRSRGGGQRHPSPPGLCVCAQLGETTVSFYMEG